MTAFWDSDGPRNEREWTCDATMQEKVFSVTIVACSFKLRSQVHTSHSTFNFGYRIGCWCSTLNAERRTLNAKRSRLTVHSLPSNPTTPTPLRSKELCAKRIRIIFSFGMWCHPHPLPPTECVARSRSCGPKARPKLSTPPCIYLNIK